VKREAKAYSKPEVVRTSASALKSNAKREEEMMQPLHHPTMSSITALDSSSGTSGSSGSSSSDSGDTTITANDFLTLLVAEMKNQDPTADTDPNAYIDQLVQVNSLQQLISINQDLGGSSSTSSSGSDSSSDAKSNASSQAISAASRLATSLAAKHTQPAAPEAANVNAAGRDPNAASQAAQAFKSAVHQS
jgi:flagellar basal-body rod modification protein FlgD